MRALKDMNEQLRETEFTTRLQNVSSRHFRITWRKWQRSVFEVKIAENLPELKKHRSL